MGTEHPVSAPELQRQLRTPRLARGSLVAAIIGALGALIVTQALPSEAPSHELHIAPSTPSTTPLVRLAATGAPSVTTHAAKVAAADGTEVLLYLDVAYTGAHGPATACGTVPDAAELRVGCAPVALSQGRGFVTLRLSAAPAQPTATRELGYVAYDANGKVFAEARYAFAHTWQAHASSAR